MPKNKDNEDNTKTGALLPYGGGGPGVDWTRLNEHISKKKVKK